MTEQTNTMTEQTNTTAMTTPTANTVQLAAEVMQTGMSYTDYNTSDRKAAVDFYNAVSNPTGKLKEHVNEVLDMAHVSIEVAELKTGELAPRIIIVTADGNSYQCVSIGVYQSLKRIFALFGTPETWAEPLKIKPVLTSTAKGQVLSLQLV